jgi:hypothetical protein
MSVGIRDVEHAPNGADISSHTPPGGNPELLGKSCDYSLCRRGKHNLYNTQFTRWTHTVIARWAHTSASPQWSARLEFLQLRDGGRRRAAVFDRDAFRT